MRGTMTQGDLSSWILAGVVSCAGAGHASATRPACRTPRSATWAATPTRWRRCATAAATSARSTPTTTGRWRRASASATAPSTPRYDYLADRGLLSPRASVTVRRSTRRQPAPARHGRRTAKSRPAPRSSCRRRPACGCRRSARSRRVARGALHAERVDHVEVAAERAVGRRASSSACAPSASGRRSDRHAVRRRGARAARRQRRPLPGRRPPATSTRHGWGVSVEPRRRQGHARLGRLHADRRDSRRSRRPPTRGALARRRRHRRCGQSERIHDLTTSVESEVAADRDALLRGLQDEQRVRCGDRTPATTRPARFEVQVNQALPFLNFTSAQWEMLVAVRNLFRDELTGRVCLRRTAGVRAAEARPRRRHRPVLSDVHLPFASSRTVTARPAGARMRLPIFCPLFWPPFDWMTAI